MRRLCLQLVSWEPAAVLHRDQMFCRAHGLQNALGLEGGLFNVAARYLFFTTLSGFSAIRTWWACPLRAENISTSHMQRSASAYPPCLTIIVLLDLWCACRTAGCAFECGVRGGPMQTTTSANIRLCARPV